MWKAIGKAYERKHPRAPAMERRSAEAVLEVLRDTRIGCVSTRRILPEEWQRDETSGSGDEGEEGGRVPPSM